MAKLLLCLVLLSISSCATMQPDEVKKPKVWLTKDNVLYYSGELEREAMDHMFSLYANAKTQPQMIQITSIGGNIDLGIEFGYWVHQKKLNITVDKYCMSSCANYIFTASIKKYLNKDSVLVWHGGAIQATTDEINKLDDKIQSLYRRWQPKERQFFEHIKVNPLICTYGSRMQLGWIEWFANYFNPILGFDYSIEGMKKFGVDHIYLKDSHWDWRKYQPQIKVKRLAVDIQNLDYSKSYTF